MFYGYNSCFSLTCKCTSDMHSFEKGSTKKLNESPTLSVGPPKSSWKSQGLLNTKPSGNRCNLWHFSVSFRISFLVILCSFSCHFCIVSVFVRKYKQVLFGIWKNSEEIVLYLIRHWKRAIHKAFIPIFYTKYWTTPSPIIFFVGGPTNITATLSLA